MAKATKTPISSGGVTVQFLIDAEDSGGSTTAFVATVGPGAMTPPPHSHGDWDETLYGIEGTMTYTVDGAKTELGPGQALCVRRGCVHQFENLTDRDATMLVVSTPGLFHEDYFASIAEILDAATDGPPDFAALMAVQAAHGVTPAPPLPPR